MKKIGLVGGTGPESTLPSYTNSTYDNPYFDRETAYKYFNEFMWETRYAKVITVEQQAIRLLQSKIPTLEV